MTLNSLHSETSAEINDDVSGDDITGVLFVFEI